MKKIDLNDLAVSALAESLWFRIKAFVANPEDLKIGGQILRDRFELYTSIKQLMEEARAKNKLAKRAKAIGAIARACGRADVLLQLHADVFTHEAQALVNEAEQDDPPHLDRRLRWLWIVVNAESETINEAIERQRLAQEILDDVNEFRKEKGQ